MTSQIDINKELPSVTAVVYVGDVRLHKTCGTRWCVAISGDDGYIELDTQGAQDLVKFLLRENLGCFTAAAEMLRDA